MGTPKAMAFEMEWEIEVQITARPRSFLSKGPGTLETGDKRGNQTCTRVGTPRDVEALNVACPENGVPSISRIIIYYHDSYFFDANCQLQYSPSKKHLRSTILLRSRLLICHETSEVDRSHEAPVVTREPAEKH